MERDLPLQEIAAPCVGKGDSMRRNQDISDASVDSILRLVDTVMTVGNHGAGTADRGRRTVGDLMRPGIRDQADRGRKLTPSVPFGIGICDEGFRHVTIGRHTRFVRVCPSWTVGFCGWGN